MRYRIALVLLLAAVAAGLFLHFRRTQLRVIHKGGNGPPTLMLLHGYASSAEHWVPFSESIALGDNGRFLFPEAAEPAYRTDGLQDGRAWWDLDLSAHLRTGNSGIDLSKENPARLESAAEDVRALMDAEGNSKKHPFILGGFSQGAMVACQVAFASDEPLAALVILSGTPVNEESWRTQMKRRKGLHVLMAHGRGDTVLPYDLAERLRAEMVKAGLIVTFVPFDGGHEIPAEAVIGLNDFLRSAAESHRF
jgi:phospholipase/carboxylesterase